MSKKRKPFIDESKLKNNPFTLGLIIKANMVPVKGLDASGKAVSIIRPMESQGHTKIFHSADTRNMIINMAPVAIKLFVWIAYNIERNKDWIWLNSDWFNKKAAFSSVNSYKKAVIELIDNGIIIETSIKTVYYVNMRILFFGSRLEKYQDHVVIGTAPTIQQQDQADKDNPNPFE